MAAGCCVRFGVAAVLAAPAGLAYTAFSEWLNTGILGSWAYTAWMSTLPLIGAGLVPLMQWLTRMAASKGVASVGVDSRNLPAWQGSDLLAEATFRD